MCIFSTLFFHNGLESWFNERNETVLHKSLNVAESYLDEHKRNTLSDCIAISRTLEYHVEKMSDDFEDNREKFSKNIGFLLDDLCGLKGVDSAILLDSYLNIIAHSKYSVALHFLNIDYKKIKEIEASEKKGLVLNTDLSETQRSIIAISCFRNSNSCMYLVIEKNVDSDILFQAKNARIAYDEYIQLLKDRRSLEIAFILMFLVVGVLLLIASITVAIVYSWRIVNPISNLIDVSEDIINGNMKARARENSEYEEIQLLCKTFNQMVEQVSNQREDLEKINKKLDERMKFTSSVLTGVSSGVIGIDNNSIYIWNTAAEKLLEKEIIYGEHIRNIFPEVVELLKCMEVYSVQKDIQFKKGNNVLLFSVKIENLTLLSDNKFVITFNDLTDVVMAQRRAALSEVARRVAHEIKNPLTPIQLSAERIRRKYLPQISVDAEIFSELVNVIIRQVGDIKRLIDEFNLFARLPEPKQKECDLREICKQAIFLMQNTGNGVKIIFESNDDISYKVKIDDRLFHQSIVNLIQNASNALSETSKNDKKVLVSLRKTISHIEILVEDNGIGFPKEKIEYLATPYFTLMPNGTGLGLVIVKKIVQDHGGELSFGESVFGGAKVTISLPFSIEGWK
jgi:two-component system nitrogen regulation sensor histidine kinase NtrY